MKLEKWALVAEVVGAFAIVVSLVLVGAEIRQSTRAEDAATYQEIYRDLRLALDVTPAEVVAKFRRGEELTQAERQEYLNWFYSFMRGFENWWEQCRRGTISQEIFGAYMSHMRIGLNTNQAREQWRDTSNNLYFLPGFREYVDRYIENNPAPVAGLRDEPMAPCQ